ncbi:hypothetical protein MOC30_14425 [Bacillus spizizenii]|nr:hypothetical protein [Bacillus spizizenii]
MKGKLTLEIDIDYATMLQKENLGAINLFTGERDVEGMVKVHMDRLTALITEPVKNMPLMSYRVDGKLITDRPEETLDPSEAEEITGVDDEIEERESDAEGSPEVSEESDMEEEEYLFKRLDEAVEHVSLNLGIIKRIKVSPSTMDKLEKRFVEEKEGSNQIDMCKYQGFDLEVEGMEENFMIVYKEYSGGKFNHYTG